MYQLFLGDQTFAGVVEAITARACAVAPTLDRAACQDLVELAFRARVRKTEACGTHPDCAPQEPLWPTAPGPAGESCEWKDLDPHGLPAMFAVAAADLAGPAPPARGALERRLAAAFASVYADLVFVNPRCGRAEVCRGEPVYPLASLRRSQPR